jgi:tetratricopeptide (TPR) repeat protein
MCLGKKDENQQLFFFRATRSLTPGQTYEVVLLSGKALDNDSNLLRGDRVLGRLQIPFLTYSSSETLVPDAILYTHLLAGRDAYEKAHYAEANRHFALALTEAEIFGPVNGPVNSHVMRSLSQLAVFYLDHGRHVEAMPFYKRVQEMLQNTEQSDDQKLAQSLFRVAFLLYSCGKYTDSEFFYHRALAMFQKHLGFEHPDVALALNNLAKLYHVQKYYDQALPLYQRSLAIFEKAVGSEHPSVGHVLNNLALLQCDREKYAEAEAFVLRSLKIREKLLGLSHPCVGKSLETYAEVLRKLNRSAEAFEVETRAKAIQARCTQTVSP